MVARCRWQHSEAPESWLRCAGITRILCGRQAHRRWHYTGPLGQPKRFVRWYIRSVDAPVAETLTNALNALRAAVTGVRLPRVSLVSRARISPTAGVRKRAAAEDENWGGEAEGPAGRVSLHSSIRLSLVHLVGDIDSPRAAETAEAEAARARFSQQTSISWRMYSHAVDDLDCSSSGASGLDDEHSPAEEAAHLRSLKRRLTALGLCGVLFVWAVSAWFIFTYGLLIFELLGADAQHSFTRSWGVSRRRRRRRVALRGSAGGAEHRGARHLGAAAPHAPRGVAGGPH